MDRIFEQAKDLHVRATYIYGKASDTAAYVDADCTQKMTVSQMKEIFLRGGVIRIGEALYQPLNFTVASAGTGAVAYVKADTSTATTAVMGALTAVKD